MAFAYRIIADFLNKKIEECDKNKEKEKKNDEEIIKIKDQAIQDNKEEKEENKDNRENGEIDEKEKNKDSLQEELRVKENHVEP